jgi:putative ABC transport system permease protein
MMIVSEGSARVVGTTANLGLDRFEVVKGGLAPRVLSGRLPSGADEIMLGRLSAADLTRAIGDDVTLQGAAGRATLRVVGIGIVPGVGGNDGVGEGGVLAPAGFALVNGASDTNKAALELHAVSVPAVRRLAGRIGSQVQPGTNLKEDPPPVISNVERVRRVPTALAVLLGVLALMTMLHALYMSMRSRRVDVAIMKGLGANRRWISRVVHSQATLLAVVPLVIGLPLGVLAGARLFGVFVNRIGALPDPTIPTAAIVAIALGALVLANVAALVPARRASRLPTATLLRVE